jgi:ABC-type uncharacterized transport system substrate-binding protein
MKNCFYFFLIIAFLGEVASAEAQQSGKIPWIGYLTGSGSSPNQAFVQGMRDLGYIEAKNIGFVYRTTEGRSERSAPLAVDIVRLNVDVIVADGTGAVLAAKKATSTIPIVMTTSTDPMGNGLIASFARPGGNVTGLTSISGETAGKLLELLKEIAPGVNRVAVLHPGGPADDLFVKEATISGRGFKLELLSFPIRTPEEIEGTFQTMAKEQCNGLIMRLRPTFTLRISAGWRLCPPRIACRRYQPISVGWSTKDLHRSEPTAASGTVAQPFTSIKSSKDRNRLICLLRPRQSSS